MKKKRGVIALTTFVLISAILLVAGSTLILTNIDLSKTSKDFLNKNLARIHSYSCLEETLYKISNNSGFTGQIDFTFTNGNCSAIISVNSLNPLHRDVDLAGIYSGYYYTENKLIDVSTMPISVLD